jgi:TolB protein
MGRARNCEQKGVGSLFQAGDRPLRSLSGDHRRPEKDSRPRGHFGTWLLIGVIAAMFGCGSVCSNSRAAEPDVIRLTNDGQFKQRPCWSPDGQQVVFARHQGDTIFLFLRDLKSGKEERLTSHTSPDYDAVFSPDGKEMLLSLDRTTPGQGDIDVYRLVLSDRKLIPLATTQGALSHEESPCWSPDGKRFAFTSTRHGNQELYVADVTGGEWQRLTTDAAIDAHPAWSPDARTIAFATDRWGNLEIALINPDGSNLRRLTDSKGLDDYPAWSPDGRHVGFTSNRDGNFEIYVQPLDGPARNVSRDPALDNFPAWTPDGRIGFVSNRDGGFDVYSAGWSLDGSK